SPRASLDLLKGCSGGGDTIWHVAEGLLGSFNVASQFVHSLGCHAGVAVVGEGLRELLALGAGAGALPADPLVRQSGRFDGFAGALSGLRDFLSLVLKPRSFRAQLIEPVIPVVLQLLEVLAVCLERLGGGVDLGRALLKLGKGVPEGTLGEVLILLHRLIEALQALHGVRNAEAQRGDCSDSEPHWPANERQ